MPKIIVTSRYIKLNSHKRFGNYIKYIATREGVEKPMQKREQQRELDRGIFINYLDSRPNSHGLFSETDDPLVLNKVAKEVANHPGALWTHIVSLKREDAYRGGTRKQVKSIKVYVKAEKNQLIAYYVLSTTA